MARHVPVRRSGSQVRRRPVRRASARLRGVQIAAIVVLVGCLVGIVGVSIAPAFEIRSLELTGARFTAEAAVRDAAGLAGRTNAFSLRTDTVADRLARLPAVASARVDVRLPGTLVVSLEERAPRLVWAIGERHYVADQNGLLFGLVDAAGRPLPSTSGPIERPSPSSGPSEAASSRPSASPTPVASATPRPTTSGSAKTPRPGTSASPQPSAPASIPAPSDAAPPSLAPPPTPAPSEPASASGAPESLGLPVVFDRRSEDAGLGLGDRIDFVSLDAGFRIASLKPADVGTTAPHVAVVLDDTHGFTLSPQPGGWVAEFGFYTPTLRKVDVIPEQVRDLRSMLAAYGEPHVAWVWLVADVAGDHQNTYLPR